MRDEGVRRLKEGKSAFDPLSMFFQSVAGGLLGAIAGGPAGAALGAFTGGLGNATEQSKKPQK